MSKDQPAADWYPQHDNLRIDALEKCIRDGSFASILNDIVAVCQHAYATFGTGPALRTAIDGCLHIEFPPADPPQDDLVREIDAYLDSRPDYSHINYGHSPQDTLRAWKFLQRARDRIVEQDKLSANYNEIKRLCDAEIDALRAQLAGRDKDAKEDADSAAIEQSWKDKQGDEYGSY